MILKFVVDFVDGQAVFLDAKETSALVSFCLRLLQIYSSHNIGKATSQVLTIQLLCRHVSFSNVIMLFFLSHTCMFSHTFLLSVTWCTISLL
jgi:hypothetical protein